MISQSILEFRSDKIGGSDLSAILGKHKFGGPLTVAQRIRGQKKGDDLYKAEFEFGNRWEKQVAQLFAENNPSMLVVSVQDAYHNGLLAKLPGFKARIVVLDDGSVTLLDPELDFMVMNADFILVSRLGMGWGVLEIKTASEFAKEDWGKTGTTSVPVYYEDQPKFYASRMGALFARMAVLIGQRDYREYPLAMYSEDEERDVVSSVAKWHDDHIVNNMPVFASAVEASTVSIERGPLEASQELAQKIAQHKSVTDRMAELKKQLDSLDAEVRAAAAEHSSITIHGEVIFTHTEKEKVTLDTDKLERFFPNVYGECVASVMTKRFAKAKGYKNVEPAALFDIQISDNKKAV